MAFQHVLLIGFFSAMTIGCGHSGKAIIESPSGQQMDLDGMLSEVSTALDAAYEELGKPEPTFQSMVDVYELAMEKLKKTDWPSGYQYSLSALNEEVAIRVKLDGIERKGRWTPSG